MAGYLNIGHIGREATKIRVLKNTDNTDLVWIGRV
jgi:hypothetical protein